MEQNRPELIIIGSPGAGMQKVLQAVLEQIGSCGGLVVIVDRSEPPPSSFEPEPYLIERLYTPPEVDEYTLINNKRSKYIPGRGEPSGWNGSRKKRRRR